MNEQNTQPNNNYGRNYYSEAIGYTDGLKYRLSGDDIIKRVADKLRGAVRDQYGRISHYDPNMRLMNDEGVYHTEFFLEGAISKVTTLTKYINEERINRHTKWHAKTWSFLLTLNRKRWDIKNLDSCQGVVEKGVYEAMLRANDGFENNNISKSYSVNENIQREPAQQSKVGGWLSGMFNRGGQ